MSYSSTYISAKVILQQYFDKRRTLANAIFNCGGSIAYFCLPPLFRVCMDTFGWQGALLMVGGLFMETIVCGATMTPVKRPELHTTSQEVTCIAPEKQTKCMGFPTNRLIGILLYTIGDLGIQMGYRVYLVYTPMRCDMLGVTKMQTAWLYTIYGIVGIPAKPLWGLIGDRPEINRIYTYGICATLSGSLTLITTCMKTFQSLIASSVLYGLLAGNLYFNILCINKRCYMYCFLLCMMILSNRVW